MSFPFSTLDLLSKYIRHDVPIYCHDHPTQPDGMNACVKDIETRLKAFELPDTADELSNPVDIGTLKLRDNAGVFEISADDGATWEAVGTGSGSGVTDHTLLSNIGNNTHAEIDSHIADTNIHGGGGWDGTLTPTTAATTEALTVDDLDIAVFLNDSQNANTYITLPAIATVADGQICRCACNGNTLSISPNSGDSAIYHEGQSGESIYTSEQYAFVELMRIGNVWRVIRTVGTWTLYVYHEN